MEEKDSKIIDNIVVEKFNEEELIIYKYLIGDNNQKLKSDLRNKISEMKKINDSIPKIEKNEQNLTNDLIKNYFEEKENNKNNDIVYTIDDLINEKEMIEKKIKDKKESIELLNEFNKSIISKKINPDLIQKINNNSYLCNNQELKKFISDIMKNKKDFQEKEELTEEQKAICCFRDLIKNSFQEAKNKITEEKTILELFKDLKFENIDIEDIINENEGNFDNDNNCIDEKIMEFLSNIHITSSFAIFIKEFHKYNPYNQNKKNNTYIFYKIINLLISRYDSYYLNIEDTNKISTLIIMHNNLELFTYLINYYILFYSDTEIRNDKLSKTIKNSLVNIVIRIKNLSISIFNQAIADFMKDLMEEMMQIDNFKDIYIEKIFDFCLKKMTKTIKMIFEFFNELKDKAIHREVIFYFNNVLTVYFNSFNEKILKVTDYNLDGIQALLNLNQEVLKNMKKNIENISSQNMNLSVKFMNILEQNMSYLKFQEILFILNSNLKSIKNYLINANNYIYIRKDDLIKLLDSTFDKSLKLTELKDYINENIKEIK